MRGVSLFLLLTLVWVTPLHAAETTSSPRPPLWSSDETWLLLGGVAASGLVSLWDEDLDHKVRANRDSRLEDISSGVSLVGHPVTCLGVAGTAWGFGLWKDDPKLVLLGRQSFEAVVVAEAATVALKYATGRERPADSASSGRFHPFSFRPAADSFPSGHTAGAFALASVVAHRSDNPYVSWASYGVAGLVGLSRIYNGEHWASDVVAGAVIGELSARLTMRWEQRKSPSFGAIYPWGGSGLGVQWIARF